MRISLKCASAVASEMLVFIKPFTGNQITLDLGASVTVEDMKAAILAQEGIPLEQQWLSFGGKRLENGHTA